MADLRTPSQETDTEQSLRRIQQFGFALVGLLAVIILGWGAQARIAGAIIAAGQVAVRSEPKPVQHLEGGIVARVHARNGMRVENGEALIRLDDTEIRANLEIITSRLISKLFNQARLEAERDGLDTLVIPVALVGRAHEEEIRQVWDGQQTLLKTRLESISGKRRQLEEQITQAESQIEGLEKQNAAKSRKASILADELEKLNGLRKKGLVNVARINALERESADLDAEVAQLAAEIARLKGKISETRLKILEVDENWRESVLSDLVDVRTEALSLTQQQTAELARLERVDIKAPQAGIVHDMATHVPGTVVRGGEPMMLIVPENEELVVRVQAEPSDIDQIYVGQPARVRFTAFDQNTTPEIPGTVVAIGADLSTDPDTRRSYYRVDVSVPVENRKALQDKDLKPGMPAEALIETGSRTALSYLLKPLSGKINSAFRD